MVAPPVGHGRITRFVLRGRVANVGEHAASVSRGFTHPSPRVLGRKTGILFQDAMDLVGKFGGTLDHDEIVEAVIPFVAAFLDLMLLIRFTLIDVIGGDPILVPGCPRPIWTWNLLDTNLQNHSEQFASGT